MIKVTGYRYEYKLEEPLSISFHTWYYRENVIVKLQYKNFSGLGEAAPFKGITGDSQDDVINELKKIIFLDIDPEQDSPEKLHILLHELNIKPATLYTAFDFAYHDLRSKIKGIPTYRLYSDHINYVPNSVTVFLKDSIEKTIKEAKRIISLYPQLQVMKIKLKGEGDIERCQVIKNVISNNIAFTLDANQCFNDPTLAVKTIKQLNTILGNIILVEEPCPKGDLDKLKYVTNNISETLIFADESAVDINDVRNIIDSKAAHGVNIKLQKTGGIWPAKRIADICEKSGLEVMVGAMLEGPIASAAGVHFAASTDNVILTDLDMDLDMKPHTTAKIDFINGKRIPSELPGLGIGLDMNKINSLCKNGILKLEEIPCINS